MNLAASRSPMILNNLHMLQQHSNGHTGLLSSLGAHRPPTHPIGLQGLTREFERLVSLGAMVETSALGPVPSSSEVDKAVASLLRFWNGTSFQTSMDSLVGGRDPMALISSGFERFVRALRLLQTEPAIKMIVISLVTDKVFWDAVMSNEAVRKVQGLLSTGESRRPQLSVDVDLTNAFLSWFLEMVKEKILELIDKFKSLVIELTRPCSTTASAASDAENRAQLEEKVESCFLLSIVILFIVVLARMAIII
ncbi:hypothetical protein MLD38_038515 [Melastoma candidum]|uniref:Uncharacterized protein n=2 Tax=Melastoma candidum TaxID=119954 RepID=A0ACB9L0C9_9MYRT|nr:hypothetical protein MLD38_038515 [Melastoma candidum]